MAGITSYSSGTLKLSDYLIGTDVSAENVTRSMPVSDIVASILAIKSIGTVTSISTSNSTFINLAGGPITTTGSLTASLSASGTPSSATYLRGDGTWAEPGPTPTDIITYSTSVPLTTDTAQWKFTGTGVTASSINDNVKVDISSPNEISKYRNIDYKFDKQSGKFFYYTIGYFINTIDTYTVHCMKFNIIFIIFI